MALRLIVLLGLLAVADSDPSSLVRRLGAPKYADREAASDAIQKLGSDALPALRAARTASDAEIRSRAVALVERIENELMVRPTPVLLDVRDQPLDAALSKLAERGRANLVLSPRAGELRNRTITLTRTEPVSFWEAVEIVASAGGVELSGGMPIPNFRDRSSGSVALTLVPSVPGSKRPPVSLSGPFRVTLLNLTHNKEKTFGGMANIAQPDLGRGPAASDSEQFFAGIQILAEPRMTVALNGFPRLTVAEDDRGNSLVPSNAVNPGFMQNSGYNQYEVPLGIAVQTTLALKYPEHAGRTIKTLRGVVSVTLTARKDDPLSIPLADSRGKSYHNADATVTIHDVKIEPNSGQTIIELSIRSAQTAEPNFNGFPPNFPGPRGSVATQTPFEIVDAQGRSLPQWYPVSQMQTPDGSRMTIRLMQAAATGPPTHLRFYEFTRVDTDVDFLFQDVDMP